MRQLGLLLALLFIVGAEGPAIAGPDEDRKSAEVLVQDGLNLARAKKFREAVAKFEEALKLYPAPEIVHSLARAHEELGELARAYDYFAQALKDDYTYAAEGRQRLARIDATLRKTNARLTVRTTPLQTNVTLTFPSGATESHLSTPFATWVPVGEIKIVGSNPNFKTGEQRIAVKAGEDRELQLVLKPLPRQGFLTVSANVVGAVISLNGKEVGKAPIQGLAYDAGVYQLKVAAEGYKPHMQEVVIVQDDVVSLAIGLESLKGVKKPPEVRLAGTPSWVGWTLVGSGAAVAAGGLGLFLGAVDLTNTLQERYPPEFYADGTAVEGNEGNNASFNKAFRSKVRPLWISGDVLMGVGGAIAVSGILLLVLDPEHEVSGSAAKFVPELPDIIVGADGFQVRATVHF